MNQPSFLTLESGDLRAVFWPDAGMLGASLQYCGEELLRRIEDLDSARQKGSTAGIPLLYPWANRLAAPHYTAAGKDVVLDAKSPVLHFDDHGLPMHGVPWGQLHWEIRDAKRDSFLARLNWDSPDLLAVFPFPHHVEMTGNLAADSLTLAITIAADVGSPVPISFGFHPYFGIPHLPREQWRLQLPAMRSLSLDARGIPTGNDQPFAAFDAALADTNFDNGFALLDDAWFSLSGAGYKITVTFLQGYRYSQIFAPRGKEFIAIEPMTAPTSALTSGIGLRVLQPGTTFQTSFRIAVQSSA